MGHTPIAFFQRGKASIERRNTRRAKQWETILLKTLHTSKDIQLTVELLEEVLDRLPDNMIYEFSREILEEHFKYVSNCCSTPLTGETDRCNSCGEYCERIWK